MFAPQGRKLLALPAVEFEEKLDHNNFLREEKSALAYLEAMTCSNGNYVPVAGFEPAREFLPNGF